MPTSSAGGAGALGADVRGHCPGPELNLGVACSMVLPSSHRIESYSCKMAGDDKHMFKQFCQEGQPHVLEALSPPQTSGLSPSR